MTTPQPASTLGSASAMLKCLNIIFSHLAASLLYPSKFLRIETAVRKLVLAALYVPSLSTRLRASVDVVIKSPVQCYVTVYSLYRRVSNTLPLCDMIWYGYLSLVSVTGWAATASM